MIALGLVEVVFAQVGVVALGVVVVM